MKKKIFSAMLAIAMMCSILPIGAIADTEKDTHNNDIQVAAVGTEDTTPPVLNSVSIDKTEVTAPGIVVLTLDIAEDIAGIYHGYAVFCHKETGLEFSDGFFFDDETGKLEIEVAIDKYKPSGGYYLDNVQLHDTARNSITYCSVNSKRFDPKHNTPLPNELTFTVINEAQDVMQGDYNGDNVVNSADVNLLYRAMMGDAELTNNTATDVNKDGKVNSADVNLLYRFVMGYIQSLTV